MMAGGEQVARYHFLEFFFLDVNHHSKNKIDPNSNSDDR
jgi:hypothetical protein